MEKKKAKDESTRRERKAFGGGRVRLLVRPRDTLACRFASGFKRARDSDSVFPG